MVIYNRQLNRPIFAIERQRGFGKNIQAALQIGIELFKEKLEEDKRRIVLFTSSNCDIDIIDQINELESLGVQIDAVGFGNVNMENLTDLIIGGGIAQIARTMDDVKIIQIDETANNNNNGMQREMKLTLPDPKPAKYISLQFNTNDSDALIEYLQSVSQLNLNVQWKESDFDLIKNIGSGGFGIVSLIREKSTYTLMEAWDYVEQITSALQLLHSVGIIHGDIKPANVLLTGDNRIKLADFGLARKLKDGRNSATASGGTL
ncbi:MAG: hypothetical protein EZS28_013087, partial [Streblomastix strix]